MRKLLFLLLATLLFAQKSYQELTFPPLGKIEIPKVTDVQLHNGMKLYLIEDHTLPVIKVWALVGARTVFDPVDKIGLGELVGMVLRTGGTENLSGDEIDERLEAVGASIEGSVGTDFGELDLWVLKENFNEIFPIFADILRYPIFDEEKIELAKIELRTEIARRNDEPFGIAVREYDKLIYGEESPYGRTIEYSTLNNIKREDLIAFHQRYFFPNNIRLGIIGDFNTEEMVAAIKDAFGDWKAKKGKFPKLPEVDYTYRESVNLAHKSDLVQTTVLMGHIGTVLKNPDYPALRLMNEILSGGFSGRLFKNIRSTRGLAYSVYGWYGAEYDHPGVFYLGASTKAESTLPVITALKDEVERVKKEPVTDEELQQAKNSYLNSFVFQFDTKGKVLWRMMVYDYYGYPRDFLIKSKTGIEQVTKEDIMRVAKKYLHPDQLMILVVSDSTKVKPTLSSLGEINTIDIYRAEKVEEKRVPEATEETQKKAGDILAWLVENYGGEEKLKDVNSLITSGAGTIKMQGKEMPVSLMSALVFPDKVYESMEMMGMKIIKVTIGKEGWVKTLQGTQEEKGKNEIPEEIVRNPINLLKNVKNPDYAFQYLGEENGFLVILVRYKDEEMKLFIDPKTKLIVKTTSKGETPQGPGEIARIFSDYRTVLGIPLPHQITVKINGQEFQNLTIEKVEINSGVDQKWFEK